MIAGLGIAFYYMATTHPWLRSVFGVTSPIADTSGWASRRFRPGSSACRRVSLVIIIVSLLTPAPDKQTQELVEHVRYPNLTGDTVDSVAR